MEKEANRRDHNTHDSSSILQSHIAHFPLGIMTRQWAEYFQATQADGDD